MAGMLYLVPTPIGNLSDISPLPPDAGGGGFHRGGGYPRESEAPEPSGAEKEPCELP